MHWIVVAVGIATAYLVLRYSPFPLWIRLLLPFSFGLASETAVVARSYSLVPILVFAICMVLTARRDRPVLFAVLVGLLANTSLPSAVYSVGFVALYLLRHSSWAPGLRGASPVQAAAQRNSEPWGRLLPAAAVLLAFWAAAVYTATPAPDVNFGKAPLIIKAHKEISPVLADLTGIPAPTQSQIHLAKLASVAKPIQETPSRRSHHMPLNRGEYRIHSLLCGLILERCSCVFLWPAVCVVEPPPQAHSCSSACVRFGRRHVIWAG